MDTLWNNTDNGCKYMRMATVYWNFTPWISHQTVCKKWVFVPLDKLIINCRPVHFLCRKHDNFVNCSFCENLYSLRVILLLMHKIWWKIIFLKSWLKSTNDYEKTNTLLKSWFKSVASETPCSKTRYVVFKYMDT